MQQEFQNALEVSKLRYQKKDDSAKIEKLRKEGKFVAYSESLVHCSMTDAVFGSEKCIVEIFSDYELADKFRIEHCEDYEDLSVACPQEFIDELWAKEGPKDDEGFPF